MMQNKPNVKKLIKTLFDQNYIVLNIPTMDKNFYHEQLSKFFKYIFEKNYQLEEFKKINQRPEQGSIEISSNSIIENYLKQLIRNSIIYDIARKLWHSDYLFYSSSLSHYRHVDPSNSLQMDYQPLHIDYSFLKTQSLNICIPATGYGGDYPGIEIFKDIPKSQNEIDFSEIQSYEPIVTLGEVLIFHERSPHRRSVGNKKSVRLNTEFRVFPSSSANLARELNLKRF